MFSHFLRKLDSLWGRSAPTVPVGGLVWHIEPAGTELFGSSGPDLAAWENAGFSEIIKRNLQRTISRVHLLGGTVYVKLCTANTPRAWAREVLRPAKARLEFENALRLRNLGIGAVEPLAWGTTPGLLPGDSYLITRAQDSAEPFLDHMETVQHPAAAQLLAREFARFLAHLHDVGAAHPDPHPGNFLVELLPSKGPRFVLTDLHAVHFGRPLSWAKTRTNLTLLNRWFQVRATRTDRLRFWCTYIASRSTLPNRDADQLARELERATEASNHRFWASRTSRYLSDNRDSHHIQGISATGYAVRDLPNELVSTWLADPDAPFVGARMLKDSRTSNVAELTIVTPRGPRTVIYKRFNLKSPIGGWKNLFRPSPALRSWITGNSVRDRGLPTARPLAVFHRKQFGIPMTGYAVFDLVPDAPGLPEAVEAHPEAISRWADRLGRLVRQMHDRRVSHRDLKAPNILMTGKNALAAEPVLIDLVGVVAGRSVSEAIRIRDLARLNASFLNSRHVSCTHRLRFLRAYLRWGLHGRGDWKSWWKRVAVASQRKAERNTRVGRPLA